MHMLKLDLGMMPSCGSGRLLLAGWLLWNVCNFGYGGEPHRDEFDFVRMAVPLTDVKCSL